jgi:hypothetical protein
MIHENLPAWIHENRSEIISAFVALIKNWDKHPGPNKIGDFKKWTQAIAGILEDAGIHGFHENRERIKVLDVHAQEQANFMEALLGIQKVGLESVDEGFTAEDFATWLMEDQDLLKAVPVDSFERLSKAANTCNYNNISRWLTDHLDQSRSGLKIVEGSPIKGKTKTFKVVEV